jgi:hypothetical protein
MNLTPPQPLISISMTPGYYCAPQQPSIKDRIAAVMARRSPLELEKEALDYGPYIDPVEWAELCRRCEACSASEENMTVEEYRALNERRRYDEFCP